MADESNFKFTIDLEINDTLIGEDRVMDRMETIGQQGAKVFNKAMQESIGADYSEYNGMFDFLRQFEQTQKWGYTAGLERAQQAQSSYFTATNTTSSLQRKMLNAEFMSAMGGLISTMANSGEMKELVSAFVHQFGSQLANKSITRQIGGAANELRRQVFETVRTSPQSTSDKLVQYMSAETGGALNGIISNMKASGLSDTDARSFATGYANLMIKSLVAPYNQFKSQKDLGVQFKNFFPSFKSMIPTAARGVYENYNSFAPIDTYKNMVANELGKNLQMTFRQRMEKDPFLVDAMKQVGLVNTRNGGGKVATKLTSRDIAALIGVATEEVVSAGLGQSRYGMVDVSMLDDPDFVQRAIRKNNSRLVGFRDTLSFLSDIVENNKALFNGASAVRLSQSDLQSVYAENLKRTRNGAKFQLPYGDLRRRYELPVFSMQDLKEGKNWFVETDPKYTNWEKYHRDSIDESILIRSILNATGRRNLKNNEIIEGMMALNFPTDWSKQDQKTQDEITRKMAEYYQHGIPMADQNGKMRQMMLVSANRSGQALFLDKDMKEAVEEQYGKNWFTGGIDLSNKKFSFSEFVSAADHWSKDNTGSFDATDAFGANLKSLNKKNVLIVDAKGLTGQDGATYISNKLMPFGFQGRMHGIKSTFVPVDMGKTTGLYGNNGVPLLLAGATGEQPRTAIANGDTDLIISVSEVKDADQRFFKVSKDANGNEVRTWREGMNYDKMQDAVIEDIKRGGLSVVRGAGDAEKKLSYINSQSAGMLDMTDKDIEANIQRYQNVLNNLYTPEGAIKYVFGNDSNEALALRLNPGLLWTNSYRRRVDEFRDSVTKHMTESDFMIPESIHGVSRMAFPFPIDFFNRMIDAYNEAVPDNEKVQIKDSLRTLELGQNGIYAPGLKGNISTNRNPSALGSWLMAANILQDKNVRAAIRHLTKGASPEQLAEIMGVDPNAVYFGTQSRLLDAMQSADFDGDMISLYAYATSDMLKNKKYTAEEREEIQAFHNMMQRTKDTHDAIFEKAYKGALRNGRVSTDIQKDIESATDEERLWKIRSSLNDIYTKQFSRNFEQIPEELRGEFDASQFGLAYSTRLGIGQLEKIAMGSPHHVGVRAFNLETMTEDDAEGLVQALAQYDVNSVLAKRAKEFITTSQEKNILYQTPFARMFSALKKSRGIYGEMDPDKVNENFSIKNFMQSVPTAGIKGAYKSAWIGNAATYAMFGDNGYGDVADYIIQHADNEYDLRKGSAQEKLLSALLRMSRDAFAGKFLIPSDETMAELRNLENAADAESRNERGTHKTSNFMRDARVAIDKWHSIYQNKEFQNDVLQSTKSFGIDTIYNSPSLKGTAQDILSASVDYEAAREKRIDDLRTDMQRQMWLSTSEQRLKYLLGEKAANGEYTQNPRRVSFSMLTALANGYTSPEDFFYDYFYDLPDKPKINRDTPITNAGHAAEDALSKYFQTNDKEAALKELETRYNALGVPTNGLYYLANKRFFENVDQLLPQINDLYKDTDSAGITYAMSKATLRMADSENIKSEHSTGEADFIFTDKNGRVFIVDSKNYMNPGEGENKLHALQMGTYAKGEFLYDDRWAKIQEKAWRAAGMSDEKIAEEAAKYKPGAYYRLSGDFASGGMGLSLGGMFTINPTQNGAAALVRYDASPENIERLNALNPQLMNEIVKLAGKEGGLTPDDFKKTGVAQQAIAGLITQEAAAERQKEIEAWSDQFKGGNGAIGDSSTIAAALRADRLLQQTDEQVASIRKRFNGVLGTSGYRQSWSEAIASLDATKEFLNAGRTINNNEATDARIQDITKLEDSIKNSIGDITHNAYSNVINAYEEMMNGTHEIKGLSGIADQFKNIKSSIDAANDAFRDWQRLQNENHKPTDQDAQRAEEAMMKSQAMVNKAFADYKKAANKEMDIAGAAFEKPDKQLTADEFIDQYKSNVKSVTATMRAQLTKLEREGASEDAKKQLTDVIAEMQTREDSLLSEENLNNIKAQYQIRTDDAKTFAADIQKHRTDEQIEQYRRSLARYPARGYQPRGALSSSLYAALSLPITYQNAITANGKALGRVRDEQFQYLLNHGAVTLDQIKGATTKDAQSALLAQGEAALRANDEKNNTSTADGFEKLADKARLYSEQLTAAEDAMKNFHSGTTILNGAIGGIAASIDNLISRFSHRAFMTVINNIKNFVKQYDASLTNIRMITLKSDEEMAEVSQNNITMARNLNTNALAVSQVQEGLFRQGLSDEQVQERTEAIIKLSRVTGINTTTASKMITTALQNGLVEDAEEAIDVLAALGDSAATTADEIQKALQKTAASAANAGISYQELTAILTAAISKTQLSGNVVGTAFSTIMTRMRKISEAGYVKASNGDITSANDVTSALSRVGVKVFEGNQMRNLVDILQDLASVWNTIDSDILKQNIVYAMAGRGANATNTFYSIMDAFGEDGEFARLLGIASGADGTVNAKYDQYINSFTGSLEAMRGAFQEWTTMITDSGVPQFFTDLATSFMRGQAAADGWVSAIGVAVAVFVAALTKAALATKVSSLQSAAGGVMTLGASALSTFAPAIALIAGIALPTIISLIGNAKQARAEEAAYREALPEVQQQQAMSLRNRTYGTQAQTLEVMQTQLEKYVETYKTFDELMANTDDVAEYQKALTNLGGTFSGDFVNDVRSACEQMDDFAKALKLVKEQMNQVTSEKTMNQIALDFAQRDDKTAYATTSTMINTLFGKGDYNKIAMTDLKDVNDIPLAMVLNDVIKHWYNSDAASITSITPRNSSNGDVYEITFDTGETIGSKQQEYTVYGNKFLSATGRRNGVFSSDLNELWYVISEMAAEANTAYPEGGGWGDTDQDNVQVYLAAAKDVLEKYGVFVKTQNGETSFTDINGEPITGETVAKKYYQQLFAGERDVTSFLSTLEGVDQDEVFEDFYDFYFKQLAEDSNVTFYKAMSRYFNPENKNGFASDHTINAIVDKTNQPKDYYFVNPMLNNQNVYDENGNFINGAVLFGVEGVTSIESQTFNANIQKLARNANATSQQIKAKQDFISASNQYDEARAALSESQDYFDQLTAIDVDYAQYLADYTQHLASEPIYTNFYSKALEQAEGTQEYQDIMRNAEQTVADMAQQAADIEGDIISGLTEEVATAMVTDVPQWYIDALAATDVIDVGRVEKTLSEEANQAITDIEYFSRDYGAEFSQAETVYNDFIGQVAGVLEEQYMSQMDDIVQMFHSQLEAGSIRDDQIVGYESKIASAESDIANIKADINSYSAALKRQEEIVAYQDELATLNASIADFEANNIVADVKTYKQALVDAVDKPALIDAESKRTQALEDIATQFQQDVGLADTLSSLLGPSVDYIEAAKATIAEKKNISEQNYAAYTTAQTEYENIMATIGDLEQEKADAESRRNEAKAQLTKLSSELVDKDYQSAVEYVNEMYKETDEKINDWFKDYTTISKEKYDALVKEQNEAVEGWRDSQYATDLKNIMAKYGNQIGGNKAKKEMEDAMARAKKRAEERTTLIYKYQETQKYFDESDRELYYDIANAKKLAKESGADHWLPYVSEKGLIRIDQINGVFDKSGRSVWSVVNEYLPNLAALSSGTQNIATEDALIASLETQIQAQYAAADALGLGTLETKYLNSEAAYQMWNDAYNKATSSMAGVEKQYQADLETNAGLQADYDQFVAGITGTDYTATVMEDMLANGNASYLEYENNKARVQTINEEMAKLFELNQPFEELFAQGNYEDVMKTKLSDAEAYLSSLFEQRDSYIDVEAEKRATEYLNKYYLNDLINNATELVKGLTSEAEADKLGLDGLWDAISTYRGLEEELANDPNLASDEYRGQKISEANEVLMDYIVELATQMWSDSPEYEAAYNDAKTEITQTIGTEDPVGNLLNLAIEYGLATVDDYKAKVAQVTEIRGSLADVFTSAAGKQAGIVSDIQDDLFDLAYGNWEAEGKDLGKTYSDINKRMMELTGAELANISEEKTLAASRLVIATANKDKSVKMLKDQARRAGITLGSGNEAEEAMAALVEMTAKNEFGYSGGDVYEYLDYLNALEGQLTEVLKNGRWFDYVFDKTGNVMWQKLGFATSDDTNKRKAVLLNMANNAKSISDFSSAYMSLGWDADILNRVFGSAENVTAFDTSLTNGTIDTVREALFKNLYGVSSSEYAQNIRKNVDESRNALREWNAFVETGYNVNSEQFANVQELLANSGVKIQGDWADALPETFELANKAIQTQLQNAYYTNTIIPLMNDIGTQISASEDLAKYIKENPTATIYDFLGSHQNNKQLNQLVEYANSLGVGMGWMIGEDNNVVVRPTHWALSANAYEDVINVERYTPQDIYDLAQEYAGNIKNGRLALRSFTTRLSKSQQEALAQQYGGMIEYAMLSESEKDTEYGRNLEREYKIQFATFGLDELEKAGKILDGITQNTQTLMSANYSKAFSGMAQMSQTFAESNRAVNAYYRAVNGHEMLTQEEWNLIGKTFGISDMTPYQTGQFNLETLSGAVEAQQAIAEESARQTYESLIKWEDENAPDIEAQDLTTAQKIVGKIFPKLLPTTKKGEADRTRSNQYRDLMRQFGFDYVGGEFKYNPKLDKTANMDAEQILKNRAAIKSFTSDANLGEDEYNELFKLSKQTDFLAAIEQSGNKRLKTLFTQMVTGGNLDKFINEDGTLNMAAFQQYMYRQQYGISPQEYKYGNENVSGFVSGLINGSIDYNKYKNMEDFSDIEAAVKRYIGSENYDELLRAATQEGVTASTAVVDAASRTLAEQQVIDLMQNNLYSQQIQSLYGSYSGTTIQRNQALRSYQQQAQTYGNALWAVGELANGGLYDNAVMQTVMNATGLSEKQIFDLMGQTDGQKQIEEIVKESIQETQNGIEEYFAAALNVDVASISGLDVEGIKAKFAEAGTKLDEFGEFLLTILGYITTPDTTGEFLGFDQYVKNQYEGRYTNVGYLRDIINAGGNFSAESIEAKDREQFVSEYAPLAYALSNGASAEQILSMARTAMYGGNDVENDLGMLQSILGEGWAEEKNVEQRFMEARTNPELAPYMEYMLEKYPELQNIMQSFGSTALNTSDALDEFFDSMRESLYMKEFGEDGKQASEFVKAMGKNARTATQAIGSMTNSMHKLGYQNKILQEAKGKSGAQLGSEELDMVSAMLYTDKDIVKKMDTNELAQRLQTAEQAVEETWSAEVAQPLVSYYNEWASSLSEEAQRGLAIDLSNVQINADGSLDLSAIASILASYDETIAQMFLDYAGTGGTLVANITEGENAISYLLEFIRAGAGKTGTKTGGGGGGGGKSKIQEWLDNFSKKIAVTEHQIKMIQFQETKYQNRGELSNYGAMVELETQAQREYITKLENGIESMKKKMKSVKKNSDDWYALRDAIMKYEEEIESANNAIEDNNRKLKENQQAIYKTRTDLEDMVRSEADTREKTRRDMLSATVSMEETILEAIRKRYQDEWDLIKRDIDRKRNALEEEKNLINERLQARKDAEQEAEKYEQLAEYQRQLAYVSMDPTRTKDALELQHKIDELQKELAWTAAEREAQAQQEAIDDQIEAYDQFMQIGDEDLAAYLEDANNFAAQVKDLLEGTQDELMAWLKANVDEYKLALDEQQQNMVESWTDTWKAMMHITETWAELIVEILTGKDSFMEYMKQSDEYLLATEEMRPQLEYKWEQMWEDYINARITGATYSHSDDWTSYGTSGSSSSGSGSGANNAVTQAAQTKHGYSYVIQGYTFAKDGFATKDEAVNAAIHEMANIDFATLFDDPSLKYAGAALRAEGYRTLKAYEQGGLANYTGLAWVDGTKTRPEAFLSADDTKLMRGFLNAAKYVSVCATMTTMPDEMFNGSNSQNIEAVNITINEATINDDMDIQELAEKIGDSFIKELSINGMNASKYSY